MLRVLIAGVLAGAIGVVFAGEPSMPGDSDIHEAREATQAAMAAARRAPPSSADGAPTMDSTAVGPQSISPRPPLASDATATAEVRALMERARGGTLFEATPPDPGSPRPLVFVSLSMPETSLRALLEQSGPVGAALVLRGLVDDSMQRTAEQLAALLGANADAAARSHPVPDVSLMIDPTLFERFEVEAVPTFVVPLEAPAACADGGACPTPTHAKLAGDVALPYALEVVAREAADPGLRSAAADWLRKSGSAK